MTTKLKKRRKSCKHGKLKQPVRTKKGGKRRCKKRKTKKSRKRKRKRKYKIRYDNLSVYEKQELIDRMNINDLLKFSKTSKENNILVKKRIRLIRNDLASNGLRQQEIYDILYDENNFFDFVKDNRINEVRVILKYFPEYINITDGSVSVNAGMTALMYASENGHTEIAILLVERGADVNAQDWYDTTALMTASRRGYTEIVRMLLDTGVHLEIKDESGDTALTYATSNNHTETARILLDNGANVKTLDGINQSVLFNVSSNFPDLYQLLIDRGADVNVQDSEEGNTALIRELEYYQQGNHNQLQIIIMLLENGADPNIQNFENKTALMYANEKGDQQIIDLLIQHGATQ